VVQDGLNKPIYLQIQEYLAELILSGQMPPEAKLPSERELSQSLDVSRMTVRRSITELVNEGLLERRHGSGTYVAKPRITYNARELLSYVKAMQTRGISTTSQLLEFSQAPASRRLADRLEIEIGDALYLVSILRLANRTPFVVERYYFPANRLPNLEEYDLEKTNINDLINAGYNLAFGKVSQSIEAVAASDNIAQQLRVDEGFPLLVITKTIRGKADGKPIEFAQDYLRSDYARIQSETEW
jgi:GntR family transcriptional regulator